MNEIMDYDNYNALMAKSCKDKLFFIPWIKPNIKAIIDYGCADGFLITQMAALCPDIAYYGYDISDVMILRAAAQDVSNAKFFSDWDALIDDLHSKFDNHEVAINLSSVIHEVYSYCDKAGIEQFWHNISAYNWGQIFVRDMMIDVDKHFFTREQLCHLIDLYPHQMADYKSFWDSYSARDIVHFLLKYRYTENWKREVVENYSPLCCAASINENINHYALAWDRHYTQVYGHQYLLPYIRNTVLTDTGIDLTGCTTHYKAVFNLDD